MVLSGQDEQEGAGGSFVGDRYVHIHLDYDNDFFGVSVCQNLPYRTS